MLLPNSAKELLGKVFYSLYYPKAIEDAMSILKILDFVWDSKNQVLVDESTGKQIPKEKVNHLSPWTVVPIKNLTNFDLDCMEKVLNTRSMKEITPEKLSPLFEGIGWKISKDGDTYRLHYMGGTDYWEGNLWNEPWDDEGLPNWNEDEIIPKEWI